ncbi:T9SS type A sorting domain-containing protein [Seonamhaeicola marinus]|nr:T9SS type A sorting domain-containing protein [Seonamhaeicola marinus]
MKKIYLLLITVLSVYVVNAQVCPDKGFVSGNSIIFLYKPGISLCVNRPSTIRVEGSTYAHNQATCTDETSTYDLNPGGTPVADPNSFTADFGGGLNCTYNSNTLPIEEIDLINKASLTLYPNPLTKADKELRLNLAIRTNAKIIIVDVNGKTVLTSDMVETNSKKIDVSSLTSGVYLLTLKTEASAFSRKFVVASN